MRPGRSTIPLVIEALLEETKLAVPGVQVLDGPRSAQEMEDDVIVIGASEDGLAAAVDIADSPGLGNGRDEEFAIWCALSCWKGNGSMKQARDGAARLFGDLEDHLRTLRRIQREGRTIADTLGIGGRSNWGQNQSSSGAVAAVSFQIIGRAYR